MSDLAWFDSTLQHLFHKFDTLEKVCMFGDPKQREHEGLEGSSTADSKYSATIREGDCAGHENHI